VSPAASPAALEDWFLWVAMFAAALYFLIGIVSLLGHRLWRVFHAVAMVIVLLLTFGLWNISSRQQVPLPFFYLLPAVWALLLTAAVYSIKAQAQRA
jgi:predicted ferric reductase